MLDANMPVQIYRGRNSIGSGRLIQNGAGFVLSPDDKRFRLLNFEADTTIVEDKIPLTFYCDNKPVSSGELYNSGDYICLSPDNQQLDLLAPSREATLFIDPDGRSARLDIKPSRFH